MYFKTDGSVRVCSDYKATVKPAIPLTEQFPIPKLKEIRRKLSTWIKLNKIDLRSALQTDGLGQGVAAVMHDQLAYFDIPDCHLEFRQV